jgi:hypothetical protein
LKKAATPLLIFLISLILSGCSGRPEPVEIRLAHEQQVKLRGEGVLVYAPDEYRLYQAELVKIDTMLEQERNRFVWFRDYRPVAAAGQEILTRGRELARLVQLAREREAAELGVRQQGLTVRLALLRELAAVLKDRRLALSGLIRMELGLAETRRLAAANRGREALAALAGLEKELAAAVTSIQPVLSRYADRNEIDRWRRQLADSLNESRRRGASLLVLSKAERQLTWYRQGRVVKTYAAGLGFNFLSPKLYGGDLATPEGLYRVTRKLPDSKYFRALLIDYPNKNDRQRFQAGRRQGLIPKGKGIGGLIEIHGGGRAAMTEGCIALDDQAMAELYDRIDLNTPVLIIGTTTYDNIMASTLSSLR